MRKRSFFDTDLFIVVYNLDKPLHSRRVNLKKIVPNLGVYRFLQGNAILPCDFEGSEFIDQQYEHGRLLLD